MLEEGELLVAPVLRLEDESGVLLEDPPYVLWARAGVTPTNARAAVARSRFLM